MIHRAGRRSSQPRSLHYAARRAMVRRAGEMRAAPVGMTAKRRAARRKTVGTKGVPSRNRRAQKARLRGSYFLPLGIPAISLRFLSGQSGGAKLWRASGAGRQGLALLFLAKFIMESRRRRCGRPFGSLRNRAQPGGRCTCRASFQNWIGR